jgi:6-pyruvoyltetrahydropterin/6-carboxytetrahydropterin synthase
VLRLTRRYPFAASHRLHSDQLSAEENARLFGKCNNPFGHGHNYVVEVSLSGEPDEASGMLIHRDEMDYFVSRNVLSKLDHANLNSDVPELESVVPTTENLTLLIQRWLAGAWEREFAGRSLRLSRVRIEETGRNSFEVKG